MLHGMHRDDFTVTQEILKRNNKKGEKGKKRKKNLEPI
jgi:hypothetical protein